MGKKLNQSKKTKKTKKCKECGETKNVNEFKRNSSTKDGYISVCNSCLNKKIINTRNTKDYKHFYIYRFLDKDNNIIYVGKTNNIYSRIYGHINIANSLNQNENQFLMYQNIYRIEYSEVKSDYHMNIYEIHYICKYNPPFNDNYKSSNTDLFDLPDDLIWKPFIFKSYLDNIQFHYSIKYGKDAINVKNELKINQDFYNEIINSYINSYFTYFQFNQDQDLYSDIINEKEENVLIDDELDYCKIHNCNIENDDECENCKDKITWRDYYNDKIKESKLKFA